MKRIFSLLLALALLLTPAFSAAAATGDETVDISYRGIRIVVNGSEIIPTDARGERAEPFLLNGSTYLPVRAVAGALGLSVDWDGASSTISLRTGAEPVFGTEIPSLSLMETHRVTITYRNIKLSIDGVPITPTNVAGEAVEPFLLNGSAYLPVRAVADALGLDVDWNGSTSTVTLSGQVGSRVEYLLCRRVELRQTSPEGAFEEEEECFDFDAEGKLLRHRITTPEGTSCTEYSYNDRGLLVLALSSGSEESSLRCLYDDNGRCIRREQQTEEGSTVTLFRYDGSGRELEREENSADHSQHWETRYDNGLLAEQTHRVDGAVRSTRLCRYDKAGHCISDTVYDADGSRSIREYSYTEAGLLRSESYRHGKDSYTHTYRYDEQGRCISERYVSGDFESRWFYDYDQHGNRIRSAHDDSTGVNTELVQSYSPENHLLLSVFEDRIHPENRRSESFTYDEQGRVIREEYAEGGETVRLVTHSYDEHGNLLCSETLAEGLRSTLRFEYSAIVKK